MYTYWRTHGHVAVYLIGLFVCMFIDNKYPMSIIVCIVYTCQVLRGKAQYVNMLICVNNFPRGAD